MDKDVLTTLKILIIGESGMGLLLRFTDDTFNPELAAAIGCGEKGTLLHCWWECELVQPLWKTVWRFLKELKIDLP
uniref:Uncharacterized protein n=1 Tax=Canis lupus dingo TaxID=286419 RepID=A0A8C0LL77_CANLU